MNPVTSCEESRCIDYCGFGGHEQQIDDLLIIPNVVLKVIAVTIGLFESCLR